MSKDPAFLMYSADFTAGTIHMSMEGVGAYIRLLCFQHQNGTVPNDPSAMMRICGCTDTTKWSTIWLEISPHWKATENNGLVNHRLTKEVEKRAQSRPKKIAAATLAGLISSHKITPADAKRVKQRFEIEAFIKDSNPDVIKSLVREWFIKEIEKKKPKEMVNQMVNNLENVNGNVNGNINKGDKGLQREKGKDTDLDPMEAIEKLKAPPNDLTFYHQFTANNQFKNLPGGVDHWLEKWAWSLPANGNEDWPTWNYTRLTAHARRYLLSATTSHNYKTPSPQPALDQIDIEQ